MSTRRQLHTIHKVLIVILIAVVVILLVGCSKSDAEVASENLSKAADQFEVDRRIVFFNGITDEYLMSIEGRCSIEPDPSELQLEVTCMLGPDQFKKHFFGLSDNTAYFVEQLEPKDVSTDHYRVIFKPETIVPDFDRP